MWSYYAFVWVLSYLPSPPFSPPFSYLPLSLLFSPTLRDTMPTQKQILQDRLDDSISKKTAKRSKNPPSAPRAKSIPGKENRAVKASKSKGVKKADQYAGRTERYEETCPCIHPVVTAWGLVFLVSLSILPYSAHDISSPCDTHMFLQESWSQNHHRQTKIQKVKT